MPSKKTDGLKAAMGTTSNKPSTISSSNIDWVQPLNVDGKKKNSWIPFPIEGEKTVLEFAVKGKIKNFWLDATEYSTQTLSIVLPDSDISEIKARVPSHMSSAASYRWPINNSVAKFVHKDPENPKRALDMPFENVWEAPSEQQLYTAASRTEMSQDCLKVGDEVLVEYTMTLYSGKDSVTVKPRDSPGTKPPAVPKTPPKSWDPGCTLLLLSVGKCSGDDSKEREEASRAVQGYDFNSTRKRRRIGNQD